MQLIMQSTNSIKHASSRDRKGALQLTTDRHFWTTILFIIYDLHGTNLHGSTMGFQPMDQQRSSGNDAKKSLTRIAEKRGLWKQGRSLHTHLRALGPRTMMMMMMMVLFIVYFIINFVIDFVCCQFDISDFFSCFVMCGKTRL